MLLSLINPIGN